jgi:hypothetical protein
MSDAAQHAPFWGGARQLHGACEWSINGLQSMSVDTNRPPTSQRSESHDSSLVFIVDDDQGMRDALGSLLRSVGHRIEAFSAASDLLQSTLPDIVSCIVSDCRD